MNKILFTTALTAILSFNLSTAWAAKCIGSTGKIEGTETTCQTCGTNCDWELIGSGNHKTLNITGSGDMKDFSYQSTPWNSEINNITSANISGVTNIGQYAFINAQNLNSVTLSDTVTSFGYASLNNTNNLHNIVLPDTFKEIGYAAFEGSGLHSIKIPDTVTKVGYGSLRCTSLNEIIIPDSWADGGLTLDSGMFQYSCVTNPSGYPNCENTKIVCQGAIDKCQKSLARFFTSSDCPSSVTEAGLTCNCRNYCINPSVVISSIDELSGKTDAEKKDLCENGMYEWRDGKCQRLGQDDCNATSKYYFNSTNNQCQVLPTTQSACQTPLIWLNNKCYKQMPCPSNCISCDIAGACTECDSDYLTNSSGTCTPAADCKNGLHKTANGACAVNDDVNCNTQEGNKCTECKGGYLEQSGACVTSCGAGYKQMENWCNRIQYTPAEAAPLLNDDNNTVTITFRK